MKKILLILAMLLLVTAASAIPANTSLYLTGNGTQGQVTFTDQSSFAHTMTNSGTVTVNTTTVKFGSGSMKFLAGNSSYLQTPTSTDLKFGTSDFSVAFWIYPTSTLGATNQMFYFDSGLNSGARQIGIGSYTDKNIYFEWSTDGTNWANQTTFSAQQIPLNQWSYIVASRNGTRWSLALNGTEKSSAAGSYSLYTSPLSPVIGAAHDTNEATHAGYFTGFIDDFIITKGSALNNTVPGVEYIGTTPTSSTVTVSFTSNVTSGFIPLPVQFNDTSNTLPTAWNWSFGDGTFSNSQNVTHTYPNLGSYLVTFNASNSTSYGLANTTIKASFPSKGLITIPTTSTQIYPGTGQNWAGAGIELPNGSYLAAWIHAPFSIELDNRNYIMGSLSTNKGKSWGTAYTLVQNSTYFAQTPVFWKNSSGAIYLFYDVMQVTGTDVAPATMYYKVTTDNATTWSAPVQMGYSATGLYIDKDPIRLTNGSVLIPIMRVDAGPTYKPEVWISVNDGITWTEGGYISTGTADKVSEISIVQRPDQTIYAGLRHEVSGLYVWQAISSNNGSSWATATQSPFFDSNTQVVLKPTVYGINNSMMLWINTSTADYTRSPFTIGMTMDSFASMNTWANIKPPASGSYDNAGMFNNKSGIMGVVYTDEVAWTMNYLDVNPADFMVTSTNQYPISNFTTNLTSGYTNSVIQFSDTSVYSPSSWNWSFGDGSYSNLQNPTHAYASQGSYQINLTVSNEYGFTTKTLPDYIFISSIPALIASFTQSPNPSIEGQLVTFTDTSTDSPTTWNWTFGDLGAGNTSTLQNPTHTYSTAGTYTVFLNISNSSGTMSNVSGTQTVVAPSGFNLQDIEMSPIYTLTIHFTDSTTNAAIPVVTVTTSDGQTQTTTNGTAIFSFPYSTIIVYASATGYSSISHSYVMDSDRDEVIQMTPTNTPSQTTWYVPMQVTFKFTDQSGNPISGMSVSATPQNFTAPVDWVQTLIGVSSSVNFNGTTVSGVTADDGSFAAPMMQSFLYEIVLSKPSDSIALNFTMHPIVAEYTYMIPVGLAPIPTLASNVVSYSLGNASFNQSVEYVNMTYVDTTAGTTYLEFAVFNTTGSKIYSTIYVGAAANSQSYSLQMFHAGSGAYRYGIFASQSQYGWINQTQTMTFWQGVALIGSSPGWVELWISVGLIVLFAGAFSIYSVRFGLVCIPILCFLLQYVMGWFNIGIGGTVTYAFIFVIGILNYIRQSENKIS